jgi:3-methyladenine DNA glycosylase Mpg
MILRREFYERDTLAVAKELLGKFLVHDTEEETTIGKVVETEAYKALRIRRPMHTIIAAQRGQKFNLDPRGIHTSIRFTVCTFALTLQAVDMLENPRQSWLER